MARSDSWVRAIMSKWDRERSCCSSVGCGVRYLVLHPRVTDQLKKAPSRDPVPPPALWRGGTLFEHEDVKQGPFAPLFRVGAVLAAKGSPAYDLFSAEFYAMEASC
jgi:hypothetical protein